MFQHEPVLLEETAKLLTQGTHFPAEHRIFFLDCTLGGAGHAAAVLMELRKIFSQNRIFFLGLDQDPLARQAAQERLKGLQANDPFCQCKVVATNFSKTQEVVESIRREEGLGGVDLLLADLGVSSPQLDLMERGFSVKSPHPLDMRMNPLLERSASAVLLDSDEGHLAEIFFRYGEEPRSRKLARAICADRQLGKLPIDSCLAFAEYCERILGYGRSRSSPAIRIFQALRIEVNQELDALSHLLQSTPQLMASSGRTAMITFHSLEDRIVKRFYREWEDMTLETLEGCEYPRGGITACEDEQAKNPRSRSARLRVFHWGQSRREARRMMER